MKICNIIASGSFNQPVIFENLRGLGEKIIFSEREKKRVFIQTKEHLVGIFPSGKYSMKGIHSLEDLNNTWAEVISILENHLDKSLFESPKIYNMVALENLQRNISLEKLYCKLKDEKISYEPEIFPGMIWKNKFGSVTIFSSGKILLMGCTSIEQLKTLLAFIKEKILY